MSAGTHPAGRTTSTDTTRRTVRSRAASVRARLDAQYEAYDSSALNRALLAAQAATGDWVAQQRLAGVR